MSNQQILEKAMLKAIKNGYPGKLPVYYTIDMEKTVVLEPLIFNHDFAKALWGDGPNCAYCKEPPHHMHPKPCPEGSNIWPYLWEYHLQQMVIADDPIAYLDSNI